VELAADGRRKGQELLHRDSAPLTKTPDSNRKKRAGAA